MIDLIVVHQSAPSRHLQLRQVQSLFQFMQAPLWYLRFQLIRSQSALLITMIWALCAVLRKWLPIQRIWTDRMQRFLPVLTRYHWANPMLHRSSHRAEYERCQRRNLFAHCRNRCHGFYRLYTDDFSCGNHESGLCSFLASHAAQIPGWRKGWSWHWGGSRWIACPGFVGMDIFAAEET